MRTRVIGEMVEMCRSRKKWPPINIFGNILKGSEAVCKLMLA
jgi:hypothetical protein